MQAIFCRFEFSSLYGDGHKEVLVHTGHINGTQYVLVVNKHTCGTHVMCKSAYLYMPVTHHRNRMFNPFFFFFFFFSKNFYFNLRRDHQKKFPMSVATMNR